MPRSSRTLMAVATVLLAALFLLPLWHIGLSAPQYPEGLGMAIRINTIVGDTPYDLGNINNLNHYIGMRAIEPDEVPLFRIMPWALTTLVALGALATIVNRRPVVYAWIAGVVAFGAVGLVEFYRWGYEYGHNLDAETAIIKIPGMSYQPPVIGVKQILNFSAESWPAIGTWFAVAAVLCAIGALLLARRSAPARVSVPMRLTNSAPSTVRG
jgi:copper chaperone NosL